MESRDEISTMLVADLRAFLKRHGVSVSDVPRSDGIDAPPRKSDLRRRAFAVRAAYDAAVPSPPRLPNAFQTGIASPTGAERPGAPSSTRAPFVVSPPRSVQQPAPRAAVPIAPAAPVAPPPASAAVREFETQAAQQVPVTQVPLTQPPKKGKARRRSSVGWLDPALLAGAVPVPDAPPPPPAQVAEVVDVVDDDARDVVVVSDYDSAGTQSDTGSVIDTDDEGIDMGKNVVFNAMKVAEVKAWLRERSVPFNSRSKKAELVSLAAAHALYLESLAPEQPAPAPAEVAIDSRVPVFPRVQSAAPVPRSAAASVTRVAPHSQTPTAPAAVVAPRRTVVAPTPAGEAAPSVELENNEGTRRRQKARVISAPLPEDDEDDGADADCEDETRGPKRTSHSGSSTESSLALTRSPLRLPRINSRAVVGFIAVLLLLVVVFSLVNVWLVSRRPFCDTGSKKNTLQDGRECQPCPPHGSCTDGELICDESYIRVDSRCIEDQEVSIYAEHLAGRAAVLLATLAGQAQCGEDVRPFLYANEIRQALAPPRPENNEDEGREKPSRRRRSRGRRGKYDPAKYDLAIARALPLLCDGDLYNVSCSETGYFSANTALIPFGCRLRRFVWNNLQVFAGLFLIFSLYSYIRRRRNRHLVYRERVESAYKLARQALLDQKHAYDCGDEANAFVVDTQLRDEILGRASSETVRLWVDVEKELKRDTRVLRSGPRTVDGSPCYIWEWRGRMSLGGGSARRSSFGSRGSVGSRASFGSADRRLSGISSATAMGTPNLFQRYSNVGTPNAGQTAEPLAPQAPSSFFGSMRQRLHRVAD